MLKLTFIPDGQPAANGLLLCATSRSLTELGVEFNHRRQISIENLAVALGSGAAALAQDFSNQRNTLKLRVRRDQDFEAEPFADPEAALLFTLDQPAQFPTTGVLQIELTGLSTNAVRWLLNAAVNGIANKFEDLGIAPAFDYEFNGGLITSISPF